MRFSWLLPSALLVCTGLAAEIYQYTDANGNRVFTDKPPLDVNAEELKLPDVNRTQMPKARKKSSPVIADENEDENTSGPYRQLSITGHEEGSTVRANDGNLLLDIDIQPPLSSGHRLQLVVDGQPHGEAIRSIKLATHNLPRGEHSIAVRVLSGERVVQESSALTLFIQRISLNSPARRAR
ncbi:MAG: DUF4124 domain-containing protein [Thiopseudomonas sp.]|nr:DUF4124 domain-containing protein [Thiopseudomonas sp.]